MHNLQALGTASLDTMGGLVTNVNPTDLPEGASPRNWDVDFIVGSVFTRAGLASVYTFTQTLNITAYQIYSDLLTVTFTGGVATVNEQFLLGGFIGSQSYLNEQTVTVTSATATTFTAVFNHSNDGPFINLNATAQSLTGSFAGPNLGNLATVVSSSGNIWTNPNAILNNTAFASSTTGNALNTMVIPGSITDTGHSWSNPSNAVSTVSLATVGLTANTTSSKILLNSINLALPTDATVVGIKTTFKASASGSAGSGSINTQLAINGIAVGTPVNTPLSPSLAPYVQGSSQYLWGLALTPTEINGTQFGVLLSAAQISGSGTISVNSFSITVYYTASSSSEVLQVTEFNFTIPATSGISGFGVSFNAYSSTATSVTLQLLLNGLPVGTPKKQPLTTTPTIYQLGSSADDWGQNWIYSNVNATNFGVQITASGVGTTFIQDLDILTYITPALNDFLYIKTYKQDDGQLDTLALDGSGIMWKEDVTNQPGVLAVVLTGILPGSYAKSATTDDREYIMFSDLSIGTERPRVYDGSAFNPLSQVGPGLPPVFSQSTANSATQFAITSYSFAATGGGVTGGVVTFQSINSLTAGTVVTIAGATPSALNITGTVLSTGLSGSQFEMDISVNVTPTSGNLTGTTATEVALVPITSIVENRVANPQSDSGPGGPWIDILWGNWSPNVAPSPGTTLTLFYSRQINGPGSKVDGHIINELAQGQTVYIYIKNLPGGFSGLNGTYAVTAIGSGSAPGAGANPVMNWIQVNTGQQGSLQAHGAVGSASYQETNATVTTVTPVFGVTTGSSINIVGATPAGWNNTWPVIKALNGASLNITATQQSGFNVTFTYTLVSGDPTTVTSGALVQIVQTTNGNGTFNGTFVIASATSTTFTVTFANSATYPNTPELGQGTIYGNKFLIDPGALTVGTANNPIYGNDTNTGDVSLIGSTITPITAGTRQAVVFFITESGFETAPSAPVIFDVTQNTIALSFTNIPIGPPNVVARGIAITEAGQNGVPGANFYVIRTPVSVNIQGQRGVQYTSTIVNDNVSTSATFVFSDAVLLNSDEVDVQGNNLFDLIELGSAAWCVPYASRMFYGLQLNKVLNFNNMTFDGGYVVPNIPAGWNQSPSTDTSANVTQGNIQLLSSPVTGEALYIQNNSGATAAIVGQFYQTAYLDPYQVAIINANTLYSVRVALSAPSGNPFGTFQILLTILNSDGSVNTTTPAGVFSVPLASLTTNVQVFIGNLLTSAFKLITGSNPSAVPPTLVLAFQVINMGNNADVLIDRIEVYPTLAPYLKTQVYGSYIDSPESIDAGPQGGIIDTTKENNQDCMGGFVMHNLLYLLKKTSMYSTEDNPNSEPSGWGLLEVSNKVGTIGIHSYDYGEEWMVTACRLGIYGFNGGQPVKISQELWNLWNTINWDAGDTIVVRNDITNKRIFVTIPLPTPNVWLPFDPINMAPTSPNVILMLNYQGFSTFEEMVSGPQVHTTMFGTLAAPDMKRKWSIWRIQTPYMDFITRPDLEDAPLFVCNGIDSEKIYQFLDGQLTDDGVAINDLYTTYGFVNAAKAATLPIFGFHAKLYTTLQFTAYGAGTAGIRILPNTINPRYPYTVPNGVTLQNPSYDDWFRPLNFKGNRAFFEISHNGGHAPEPNDTTGAWFNMSKILISGKAHPWAPITHTGGGNAGITTT